MAIKYSQSPVNPNVFRTIKYGNVMSDTIQGEVDCYDDETWSGWFTNLSNSDLTEFRYGFKCRAAAARWVNAKLRARGVED